MKRQTIAATLLAAALLIFVFFKFSAKPSIQTFSLIGKWQLDSGYAMHPLNDSMQRLMATVNVDEKNRTVYTFNADSSLNRRSIKDDNTEKYYVRDSALYVDQGYGYLPYSFKTMTDSLIEFFNKDSIVFVLKKK
jgi:hypothetical protein